MTKKELVYVTPRFPWPLVTGDRIRCFNLLRELSEDFDVSLIVLDGDDQDEVSPVREMVSELITFEKKSIARCARDLLTGMARGMSLQESLFLRPEIQTLLEDRDADVALIHLLRANPNKSFVPARHYVLDMCDPVSLTYAQIVKRGSKLSLWYYISLVEYWLTKRREKNVLNDYARVFLHSQHDIEVAGLESSNVRVSTMGLSVSHLEPFFEHEKIDKQILFVGNLDYYPNRSGLEWFITQVFYGLPPNYVLNIVGAGGGDLIARHVSGRIRFHGRAPELVPHMRDCSIGIAPMFIASGVQNKVLEYLYSGLNVVCSEAVMTGLLPAYTRGVTAVGKDSAAWIDAIVNSTYDAKQRKSISSAVARSHDWTTIGDEFKREIENA